jgi:2-oxoglutarate ferredoxin oxidoreductase subunit alpha
MKKGKKLLSGNEAITKAAIDAGLGFFSSYPITPASEIMEKIATTKIDFIQAEDEIASINMAIGASLAGKKTMVATSGPGFSLMQESIGLAYKIESPVVIVNAQRVGPSTGMPTFGSQGDVLQARYGSHGDYNIIVFTPNSVQEAYKLTIESFNAAEESLSPVILLTEGIINKMYETTELEKIKFSLKKRKLKPLGKGKRHFTGLTSSNGLPATGKPEAYRKWYKERKNQINAIAKKYNFYEYLENKNSDTLIIAYGITSRVILPLKEKYSIFRPIKLFPIIDELKNISKNYKKIIVIEMNDGQYAHEIQSFLKREIKSINQLGGKVSLREIKNQLK